VGPPRPRVHLIRYHGVLAPNAKLRALVIPRAPADAAASRGEDEVDAPCGHHRSRRMRWARLLKRVFEIDMAHCPQCGGALRVIAVVLEAPVIERILTHLGLQPRAPPRAPARHQQLPLQGA